MLPNETKEPGKNLQDKIRSFFGPPDPQKKKDAFPPKAHFSIWYFLIAFLLFSFLQQYYLSRKVETIPYSQFKQDLAEGHVNKSDTPRRAGGLISGAASKAVDPLPQRGGF